MDAKGFPADDPLRTAVSRAEVAVYDLRQIVHYLACGDVVHRRRDMGDG
jgi:hypothetical protein